MSCDSAFLWAFSGSWRGEAKMTVDGQVERMQNIEKVLKS